MEEEERQRKKELLLKNAYFYYNRKDIQKTLFEFSKNREVVPLFFDKFGKRPDMLQYESDVFALAKKGVTSFHCSEELWSNPLEISTELSADEINKLRIGWTFLLDIDCKFIDYSKAAAEMLIEALKFHNIKNIGLKFSGSSGFHLGIDWKAFPKKLNEVNVEHFFPEGPRIIASYLKEIIYKSLAEKILALSSIDEIIKITKKKKEELFKEGQFNPYSVLEIDTILLSPRHLFRMPYSLNEKAGLASIVIKPEQIKSFHLGWAKPERVFPKQFLPEPEENEARELLVQALDWNSRKKLSEPVKTEKEFKEIDMKSMSEDFYPPCIKNILSGVKQDGRKRALFILLNFLRSINMDRKKIEETLDEWNNKNYKKLRDSYMHGQISWHMRQKKILPPNCDKPTYKELAFCQPDGMCKFIKNPVNYAIRRVRLKENMENFSKKKRRRKKQED